MLEKPAGKVIDYGAIAPYAIHAEPNRPEAP